MIKTRGLKMHEREEECFSDRKIRKNKPDKRWTIDVDVYLYEAGPPAVFDVDTCLPSVDDPHDSNRRIVFHNSGRPGFMLRYRLFDNTNNGNGSGYVFPSPPGPDHVRDPLQWAMWSREGHDCPPAGYHAQWDEFTSVEVQDNGTTLLVWNKNQKAAEFAYTLRVTNDGGQSYVDLDPGGNNMNGGIPLKWR